MGLFDRCLIASDVDETLFSNGQLPSNNKEKIEWFVSQGGTFCVSTGRTASALKPVTNRLDCVAPSIVANGAMIYDLKNEKVVYELFVGERDKQILLEAIRDFDDIGIEVHSGNRVLTVKQNKETDDHQRHELLETVVVDAKECMDLNWTKVIYFFNSPEERTAAKEKAFKSRGGCDFFETSTMIDGQRRYYYEQLPRGASKGTALLKLCEIFNIKSGCCYAIGDYYNDVPMLQAADISAATGQAPDEVKKIADVVVCDAENGSVADFIDYLTKIRKEEENGRKN